MSRSKGTRREKAAADVYEAAGYETYRPETTQYGDNDVFNLFDMLAIGHDELRMIQVKSNRAVGIHDWLGQVAPFESLPAVKCDFLVFHDYQGWRLLRPCPALNYSVEVDERQSGDSAGDELLAYLED